MSINISPIVAKHLKGQFHEIWGFFNGFLYIERTSFRDPPLKFFKFFCCVVVELFNLKDPMWLIQKTYLFLVQIEMPLQMHLKSVGYTDTLLFPTIGNAVNVQSPDIGKPDIYHRKD
jgi:hypothetical protein